MTTMSHDLRVLVASFEATTGDIAVAVAIGNGPPVLIDDAIAFAESVEELIDAATRGLLE